MKTRIKDINDIEICVGDKVIKVDDIDKCEWVVKFDKIKLVINNAIKTIYTFILESDGYEQVMEMSTDWQYSNPSETRYEIVK